MSLIETDIFGVTRDKVQTAIERMRLFEPPEGYYLAYSGGKDSDTILALAKMAGVKFDAHYNLTTVDPPELVWHVKKHPEVSINRPKETMWQLIVRKRMPPTRMKRYCCDILKERGGTGRVVMTGIRAEESIKRAHRQMVETCFKDVSKRYFHPIIDWNFDDVWGFIRSENVAYCSLYDEGWKRLGCVLCPYSNQKKEARRWPKIARAYKAAISRAWRDGPAIDKGFDTPDAMWNWWLSGRAKQEDGGLFT